MTGIAVKGARLSLLGAGIAALTGWTSPAAAAEPLQPVSEWQFGSTAESCTASREFTREGQPLRLRLRSFGPGSAIEATVANEAIPNDPFSAREVNFGWDGEIEQKIELFGTLGTLDGLPSVTILMATRPVFASFKGYTKGWMGIAVAVHPGVRNMEMKVVGAPHLTLAVGPLDEPLQALEDCESGLLRSWDLGADYAQAVAEVPQMVDAGDLWHAVAYPAAPLLNHIGGIAQMRLRIDTSGKVADCVVQSSPGSSRFGSDSCRAIKRKIRYTPARDEQGQPVPGYAQLSITFGRF